jgi:hypothetical protein
MATSKHIHRSSTLTSGIAATLAILAPIFISVPAFAQVPDEAAKPAAADDPAKPVPADEAAKPAEPAAAAQLAPVEPPKCDCPPPCPAPSPPPPPSPANPVEWKAQSKGGMLITGGNSQSKNFTFGMNGFRKEGNNKLALEGGLAYGTSNSTVATVNNNTITSIDRKEVVSTNNWAAKGRYDRFLTENNVAYASGQGAADKIAGKTFYGGGQAGYSRQLLNNKWNIVVAELGYDFSYERYIQQQDKIIDPVTIHSARVLIGETLSLTQETGLTASVEALFNLNKENKAINAKNGTMGVEAFKDTRINGKVGLSTNLWKQLSFGFSFGFKYDQNPAPRPMPSGTPSDATLPPGLSLGYAKKVDTITEATLIYTFF